MVSRLEARLGRLEHLAGISERERFGLTLYARNGEEDQALARHLDDHPEDQAAELTIIVRRFFDDEPLGEPKRWPIVGSR